MSKGDKFKIHHSDCPKVHAWDLGPEEGIQCWCPKGWPKTQKEFEKWYLKNYPITEKADSRIKEGL